MEGANAAIGVADQLKRGVHPFELVDLAARFERIEPVDSLAKPVHRKNDPEPGVYRLQTRGGRFVVVGAEDYFLRRRMPSARGARGRVSIATIRASVKRI